MIAFKATDYQMSLFWTWISEFQNRFSASSIPGITYSKKDPNLDQFYYSLFQLSTLSEQALMDKVSKTRKKGQV